MSDSALPNGKARRVAGLVLLAAAIAAGLGIHYGTPGGTFSDIAGDVLYAVAAYAVVMVLAPRGKVLLVAAVAGAWCVAIELFQLTGIPLRLGAAFAPFMLVLGTVFDPRDIVVYAVTVAVVAVLDAAAHALASRRRMRD